MRKLLLVGFIFNFISSNCFAKDGFIVGIDTDTGLNISKSFGRHEIGVNTHIGKSERGSGEGSSSETQIKIGLTYKIGLSTSQNIEHFLLVNYAWSKQRIETSVGNFNYDVETKYYGAFYGIEYFMTPKISLDGLIGLRSQRTEADEFTQSPYNSKYSHFPSTSIGIRYYF